MKVSICGIPYQIIECDDNFDIDLHFGEIKYGKGEIYINKCLSGEIKDEALCHEILHGILVHLGYIEQSQDEQFVQAVGNAIYQTFQIKKEGADNDNDWEIYEDEPDSAQCPIGYCWWDDIPEEEFICQYT